jgi:hypothetical protein
MPGLFVSAVGRDNVWGGLGWNPLEIILQQAPDDSSLDAQCRT